MSPCRYALRLLAGCLLAAAGSVSASTLNLGQQPLFLTTGVDPNIVVTIDNSNSMKWGFIPDWLGYSANGLRATRRVKSSAFNAMYYNPGVTYALPKKVTFSNGTLTVANYAVSSGFSFDFTKVYVNGFRPSAGTIDLSSEYRVAWEYDTSRGKDTDYSQSTTYGSPTGTIAYLAENPNADFGTRTKTGVPAYYYVFNAANANCNGLTSDEDCYTLVNPTSSADRQNFAIWYAFYRNRALSMQSSANLAFSQFSRTVRITWQDLSNCTTLNSSGSCRGISYSGSNQLLTFDNQARANFFNWLSDVNFNTGTPLRAAMDNAGKFLQTTGVNGPYAKVPWTTQSPEYACRPSYQVMMTDGKWNSDSFSVGNLDGTSRTLPDGKSYTAMSPFQDSASNTLADLAFKYWYTDAQPNIANKLAPYVRESSSNADTQYWNPKNDPATWQHLVTYTVGFGLSSSLTNPAWGGSTYAGGYSSSMTWPAASSDSDNNVYDLWHAALNSRGEFFSADDANGLVSSLNEVVTRIAQANSASASQASSPLLDSSLSSNYTYVPTFSSTDWSGDLTKYLRSATTTSKVWSAQAKLDATYGSGNYAQRKVYMASGGVLKDFAWANLSDAQKTSLNRSLTATSDSYGADRVTYLKGNRSQESLTAKPAFRIRNHLLGDIIDSTPALVTTPSSPVAKMNALVGTAGSYTAFLQTWAERASRIYVGANDGMLHAFDDDGNETFAFIPSAVIANLYKLTDTGYGGSNHQFYVDGSPVVQDVYFGGAWHTVLVGTLRGGAQAIFALDITDPSQPKLLWEKSASDSDYAELGFTYSKPVIARLHTGDWGVILANGYNGANDKALLYVLNVADGSRLAVLEPTPNDGLTSANGLSTPAAADVDGDLVVDYVYAGDLRGNLWRFDLLGSSLTATATASNFKVAFGGAPLYRARSTSYTSGGSNQLQAIMAAPLLVRHPSGTGYLLVFGTGKYLETADATAVTSKAMSFYGIWDRQTDGSAVSSTPTLTTANLQQQTLGSDTTISYTSATNAAVSTTANTLSSNAVNWYTSTNTAGQYGWYLNLPLTGEMSITRPLYLADTLFAATLTPNDDPCDSGAVTYLYALDPFTGGATDSLQLGTTINYSRLQMAGLLSGLSAFIYGNGTIAIGGTTITSSNGSDTSTVINEGQSKGVLAKSSRFRQTWRTVTNENPD
ncbi:PilC/PilY family type IV pilus protein [Pseudomonas oryzihabitans]|uniref:pilus assembly protein n=1 Tax=Pseudomonas oryzihabitans TaxID=47885 RepID=UPI00289394D4|nr:PilC/PilY family type IV pilus protein [Pseudomonas oryzihabitans]MDT3722164.1 PilC/PilY family type IV pilus protein [Pseudomonas oryzihabitans]